MYVWDQSGKRYLDMTAGIGVLSTGHSHPHVVEAIKNQAETMVLAQQAMFYSHTQQNILVERLLKLCPPELDAVLFTSSGSEATENAMKVARMVTQRPNVIVLHKGFHGRTFGGMSWSSSKTNYRSGFGAMLPGVFFCPTSTAEAFDSLLEHQCAPHETCAVMLEPILGEGGVISLPREFLAHVKKRCDEHGMMLIYDEVQCGVGRCGQYWGYQATTNSGEEVIDDLVPLTKCEDIHPDIICFAKGIGSGVPMGGVITKKKFFNAMTNNALGSTYGGNALCSAAANAVLDVMFSEYNGHRNVLENARKMGALLKKEIDGLRSPLITSPVRQRGLLLGVDIDPKVATSGQVIKKAVEEHEMITHSCGSNSLRIIPSLIITEREVEIFVEKLDLILKDLEKNGAGDLVGAKTM